MLVVARGLFLALTVSLGIVTAGNHGSAPSTTTPETVLLASDHTTTTSTTVPPSDYNIGEVLWQTWRTDPTAYKPSATDPMRMLPMDVQVRFQCIRYTESRNHPNDTNQQSGAEGLYQFMPYLWKFGASHLGIHTAGANQATPEQQSAVAVWYYNRNHGFYSEWRNECTQ